MHNRCIKKVFPVFLMIWAVIGPQFLPLATAQMPHIPLKQQPGSERPRLPEYQGPPAPEIVLPPLVPPSEKETDLIHAPKVFVRTYKFIGNTIFSDKTLSTVTAPYANRKVSFEELQALRLRLTRYYVDRGYINSGAVIPDQQVVDGTVAFVIIEGRLSEIGVIGNTKLRSDYIRNRLALGAGPPLRIGRLQERVQLLHQNPLIRRINAGLGPGLRLGEAVLKAKVEEESPYRLGFRFDNHESPSIGAERGSLYAAHRNLTGWGDELGLEAGLTEGLDDFSVHYSLPLNARDTTLTLRYDRSDASVIEQPFDALDVESESETWGLTLAHPLFKKPDREFRLGLTAELRHSETFLLGHPFSFSTGVQDGESDVTVIRFSQEWLSRGQTQVFAARSVFSMGIDAFGATQSSHDPDGRYVAWLGQFQWARRLDMIRGSQMIFRTDMQFCNESVLPLEQFAVGGATSVRGYRENEMVRDNGLVASLECRIPVFRLPLPGLSKGADDGSVQIAPFFDWGWAENSDLPTPDPRSIASAGVGLRWDPTPKIHADIYWGIPFRDVDNAEHDLQDSGIHFQISWRFF